MNLSDIAQGDLEAAVERMYANDALVDDVATLKKQVALLQEVITILCHDINARLERRNAKTPIQRGKSNHRGS